MQPWRQRWQKMIKRIIEAIHFKIFVMRISAELKKELAIAERVVEE